MPRVLPPLLVVVATLASLACIDAEGAGEGEGEGEPLGAGVLEAEPAECDLGPVEVGSGATCDVTLRNRGEGPLRVVSILVDGAPSPASDDVVLLPGGVDAVVVPLEVTPAATGIAAVVFTFITDAAPLDVTVRFFGTCAPTAAAAVRINGALATAPYVAAISDDVVLDAAASAPCPGSAVVSAAWGVLSQPADASTSLTNAEGLTIAIADPFPGTVDIGLAVVDDAGAFSTNAAVVSVRYLPQVAFTADDALLLGLAPHLFRDDGADGERCTSLDCFDGEGCGFVASAPPEWDGATGRTAGDPLFDEAVGVSVRVPVDGTYVVGVHARADAIAATRLAVDGAAPLTSSRVLAAADFWTVARVSFAGGIATVEALDVVDPAVVCVP